MSIGLEVKVIHVVCEDDIAQQELGVKLDFSRSVPEVYTLYNIDYTKRYDNNRGVISSAGLDFIVDESYESLNKRIEQMGINSRLN